MKQLILLTFLLVSSTISLIAADNTPVWRGQPGTEYLGPDVLWRPREWLIFNMLDEKGTGFKLNFTVRDMNTYMQGPTPVFFVVIGPNSEILGKKILEDDGIMKGNEKHQDGIYDPFADFRYRQWHAFNSPGGYPPNKSRSPYLKQPSKLPARSVSMTVPAAGKGLYRVGICSSWDHWVSITPNRPIATGVSPGKGPLYIPFNLLNKAFFWVPEKSKDIGVAVTEEIKPYNWSMVLKDDRGSVLDSIKAKTFCSFIALTPPKKNAVYEVDLKGVTTGTCLHGKGFPMIICPDKQTAEKIQGGMKVDEKGRHHFFAIINTLNKWADSLQPEDLKVDVTLSEKQKKEIFKERVKHSYWNFKWSDIETIINNQNLDPNSPDYGQIKGRTNGRTNLDILAFVTGLKDKNNPYYGNPALIRRVLLTSLPKLRKLSPEFWFNDNDQTYIKKEQVKSYFETPTRSGWYGLGGDGRHVLLPLLMKAVLKNGLPNNVINAWKQAFNIWACGRWMMHAGEVANQWTYNLEVMNSIYKLTEDKELKNILARHVKTITTPGLLGRLNPDRTPFDKKVKGGYDGRDVDRGLTPAGYLPEQLGFDGEYSCEQTMNLGWVWETTQQAEIIKWMNHFNDLKTHMTLSKTGKKPTSPFAGTCSPTDLNSRTRYYTHKNHMPKSFVGKVQYLDLWHDAKNPNAAKPWPFMAEKEFVKLVDQKFLFTKTPDYYAINYLGPRSSAWGLWSSSKAGTHSVELAGYSAPGYGGWGRSANKPGGLSALWVKNCGPVILGQNHTVMDSNTVWGMLNKPVCSVWRQDVNPYEVASCFGQSETTYDEAKKSCTIKEKMLHAPLEVTRIYTFKDSKILVDMTVKALENIDLKELNLSIPYYDGKRIVTYSEKEQTKVSTLPEVKALQTPARPRYPDAKLEKKRWTLPPFKAQIIDISAQNGAGATLVFDKAYNIRRLWPIRYRNVAAEVGALMLSLPAKFAKGQALKMKHMIVCHPEKISEAQKNQFLEDQFLKN